MRGNMRELFALEGREMKFSFVTKLAMFSIFMLSTLTVMIGLSVWNMNQLSESFDEVAEVMLPAVRQLTLADMYHDGVEATVYRSLYAVTSKDEKAAKESLEAVTELKGKINECLDTVARLRLRSKIKTNLKPIRASFDAYIERAEEVITLATSGKIAEAQSKIAGFHGQFEELEKLMMSFSNDVENDVKVTEAHGHEIEARSRVLGWLALLGGVLLGAIVSLWTVFDVRRRMRSLLDSLSEEAEHLRHSSASVQKSAHQLSSATSQQSAAIEETVASMEEMSSMLAQTTQQASRNLEYSETGQSDAGKGRAVMAKMAGAMDEIQASNTKLDGMVRMINEIREKTNVINEIVAETRLLSFNASIEAARAGAHGKGFAVVAEEVGKLAAMSGKAASDIRELLESSTSEVNQIVRDNQERVQTGKRISDECETMFNSMKESLEKIAKGIQVISSASQEQETGVKQTNRAMNDMSASTQSNLRSVEELSGQSARLASGSESLNRTVDVLRKVMIGGRRVTADMKSMKSELANDGAEFRVSAAVVPASMPSDFDSGFPITVTNEPPSSSPAEVESVKRSDSRWRKAS
jgi:methyl-accepting chemotaxis protein